MGEGGGGRTSNHQGHRESKTWAKIPLLHLFSILSGFEKKDITSDTNESGKLSPIATFFEVLVLTCVMVVIVGLCCIPTIYYADNELQSDDEVLCIIVFCVGGSKELAVLYASYSTATFVMQHSFVRYR